MKRKYAPLDYSVYIPLLLGMDIQAVVILQGILTGKPINMLISAAFLTFLVLLCLVEIGRDRRLNRAIDAATLRFYEDELESGN